VKCGPRVRQQCRRVKVLSRTRDTPATKGTVSQQLAGCWDWELGTPTIEWKARAIQNEDDNINDL
jgi:hypothetical protein